MATRRTGLLAVAALLAAAAAAQATVFAPMELSELVAAARAIIHGRIVDMRPQLTDDRRRVDTLVTIEAATYLKGNLGSSVTFRVPGGELGRYRTVVLDAPRFAIGEEVVLLLGARGPSIPYVLGLSQGVFRVRSDATTGDRRIMPAPLIGEGTTWQPVVRGEAARRPMSLTEFARRVQTMIGDQR